MMKIHISNLGPVNHADIDLKQITVLTGFQASGKSTIAKTVYFFRTLKNDLIRQIRQYSLNQTQGIHTEEDLIEKCMNAIRNKLVNTFGDLSDQMMIQCIYSDETSVCMKRNQSGELNVLFSDNVVQKIKEIDDQTDLSGEEMENSLRELGLLFDDEYQTVYIPAGRSLITLLGEQYLLFYSSLDDNGKRMIDECTQDFIRLITVLKPNFSNGLTGLTHQDHVLKYAQELSQCILNGTYEFRNGEERLVLGTNDNDYVRMNYASSGQQSSVWIINLLYYYLAGKKKTCFIIEEPELNLFPESQKYMTDLIMLAANAGMQIIVTTHSPYILGELNNILIASRDTYTDKQREKLRKIIPDLLLTDYDRWSSYFVKNGTIENIMDDNLHQMDSDQLDAVSSVINDEYDRIIECTLGDTEE